VTGTAAVPQGRQRVLVVHPSAELYGSDRVAVETVAGLREAGHEVLVVLAQHGPLEALLAEQGVPVRVLPGAVLRKSLMSPRGLLRFLVAVVGAVPPALRLLRERRPDVVYVSTVTLPLWLVLARLGRRRVVCHVHEAEETLPRVLRTLLTAEMSRRTSLDVLLPMKFGSLGLKYWSTLKVHVPSGFGAASSWVL